MAFDDEALKLVNSIWAYKLTVKKCIDMRKVNTLQAMWIRRRLVVAGIMVINTVTYSGATVRFGFFFGQCWVECENVAAAFSAVSQSEPAVKLIEVPPSMGFVVWAAAVVIN
eukprot:scaffold38926_cov233-Skeletonema_dohrnii-CCMP3373.AAC.2